MIKHSYPGLFIAFEGLDGSGSSTQVDRLKNNLNGLGFSAHETKEPTNNMIGGLIRGVLTKQWHISAEGFQLLFAADRAHHLTHTVIPQLEKGSIIITDRYAFSSIAYGSLELNQDWLETINENFILPDITILLKVDPKTCMARIGKSRGHIELFEEEKKLAKVWQAYEKLANDSQNGILVIDGETSKDEVEAETLKIVKKKLDNKQNLAKQE